MAGLRKAQRRAAKIRLGLASPSGGGKTYSALLIAKGLAGSWDKVAIIDTENGSADLYSHLGDFNVLQLTAPYHPEKYIDAIRECEQAGMEVIIIDSITHEWSGVGGCLELQQIATERQRIKNTYTAWKEVTPRHQKFIDAVLQSNCHIITTVRSKTDYLQVEHEGKKSIQKVGMAQVTRDGFEYELTVSLELDVNHYAVTSKDRTCLFEGKPSFIPSEETGKMLKEWCESGVDIRKQCLDDIEKCQSKAEVDALIVKYDSLLITNEAGKRVFPAEIASRLRNKVESFRKA
jgi:hypothetical protein